MNIYIYIYIYYTELISIIAQLARAVEYTDCFSALVSYQDTRPGYDTKQSDGEVLIMMELWGMQSTPLLPSLPTSLRPGVVAPDEGPISGLNRTKLWFELTVFGIETAYLC